MENIDKSRPIILLDHQPYNLTDAEAAGIDLQFSGHTHHGQVWPMSLVTDYIYEQSHGYRQWGDTHIYVSSGLSLGTSLPDRNRERNGGVRTVCRKYRHLKYLIAITLIIPFYKKPQIVT